MREGQIFLFANGEELMKVLLGDEQLQVDEHEAGEGPRPARQHPRRATAVAAGCRDTLVAMAS